MKSSDSTFYNLADVKIMPRTLQSDYDAGCASDGTGYKVTFVTIPASDGAATVTIKAVQTGTGLTGSTSFTLRRDTCKTQAPTLGNLPNASLRRLNYQLCRVALLSYSQR
ncbi:MAG TPA: hypothetical protein VGI60_08945 [Chthoniobacterales bacterium]|jgi:hypothetical protein